MNYVVTGSEGFLGRQVVARLAASGCSVFGVDRLVHTTPRLKHVTYHQSDLEVAAQLLPNSAVNESPFTLIHLAWDMRRHEGYAIQAGQIKQLAHLLDYWGARGLSKVIAMGSAEEYGQRLGKISELDHPEFPLSPYGWAKHSARDLAKSWSQKSEIPCVWLRPFIMYGPGQKGDMLIPSAIEAARTKQKTKFTDGRQRRDFVFIEDVVEAIWLSVQKKLSGFHEFNLGRGEEIPVAHVLMAIARHFNAESLFELGARPRRPGEPDVQIADTTHARLGLGWEASTSCSEGIKRLCESCF